MAKLCLLIAVLLAPNLVFAAEIYKKSALKYWSVVLGETNYPRRCNEDQQARAILHAQEKALGECRERHDHCALVSHTVNLNGQLDDEILQKYGIERGSLMLYYGCEATSAIKGL